MTSSLPLIEREIRIVVRRPRTYSSRMYAASIVSAIVLTILYAGFAGGVSPGSAGTTLFVIISVLGYLYVLIEGVCLTADCLSQEKREGTLGLLFLTGLRGYDVVAGKLVSRSANTACCVLGALPALGLTLFLGGIAGADFVKMVLSLLNCLFFAVSFGLLVSALSRDERLALNGAVAAVLLLAILFPLAGCWLKQAGRMPLFQSILLFPSPGGAFIATLIPVIRAGPVLPYWTAFFVSHLASWGILILASAILPHMWAERSFGQTARTWLKSFRSPKRPDHVSPSRIRSSRAWLDSNPIIWLGVRSGKNGLRITFAILTAAWFGIALYVPKIWFSLPVYFATAVVAHAILMYDAIVEACRGAINDRRHGVLELLLTTPLGDNALLRGRLLSLKRRLVGPVLFVMGVDLACLAGGCWQLPYPSFESLGWMGLFLFLIAKLFVDLYTLTWVGVWQGFKAKNTYMAVRRTFSYVVLVRWALLIGTLAFLALVTQGELFRSGQSGLFGSITVLLYLVTLGATTLHYCGAAMNELTDDLRALAASLDEREMEAFWRPFGSNLEKLPRLVASFNCARKMRSGAGHNTKA